jgi:hypothetical protein
MVLASGLRATWRVKDGLEGRRPRPKQRPERTDVARSPYLPIPLLLGFFDLLRCTVWFVSGNRHQQPPNTPKARAAAWAATSAPCFGRRFRSSRGLAIAWQANKPARKPNLVRVSATPRIHQVSQQLSVSRPPRHQHATQTCPADVHSLCYRERSRSGAKRTIQLRPDATAEPDAARRGWTWAQLMRRAFDLDVTYGHGQRGARPVAK